MSAPKPLTGVRVLDLTRLLPGAYATLLLADLGADVIKIEEPGTGDHMRHMAPLAGGRNVYFERLNRNKRSVTLNLKSPDAAVVFDALVAGSDAVVESFRPSTARRLRVDAASLHARHPRLVCASMSGFGQSGPNVERAAHDINYESLAGLLKPPALPGALIGDVGAATQTALAVVAALFRRERDGAGAVVDVSIHEAALAWSIFPTTADLQGPCYNLYETADHRWVALGALEPKFWSAFCSEIGRPDLVALQHAGGEARERVLRDVQQVMRSHTLDDWIARFAEVDACVSAVYSRDEARADPHAIARGVVPGDGAVGHVAPPWMAIRPAPALGAHTDEVLSAAGIGDDERRRLREGGVI